MSYNDDQKQYKLFERDIEKAISKLSKKKSCENFGEKEQREIRDKWSDYLTGNWQVVRPFVERFNAFQNWCDNYVNF